MIALFSRRLLRTTAFRAALLYTCAFSLLAALGMGFIYWSTKNHIVSQVDARLRLETEVLLDLYRRRAMPALLDTVRRRSSEDGRQIFFYMIWDDAGGGWMAGQPPRGLNAAGLDRRGVQPSYATFRLGDVLQVDGEDGDNWVRILSATLPGNYRLLVGRDLNEEKKLLDHTLTIIISVAAVIFLLALTVSLVLGQRTLRRIDAISRTAGEFMAGDLSRRLPLSRHGRDDEFDQLSRKLNTVLARIEQLLAGMRQVTDNVAHDLRKPLNRLRNRLEVTLLEARGEEEYRAVIEHGIQDADELLKTFNALLSIAQAEAGIRRNQWGEVSLGTLIEDVVDLYGALAEDADIALSWSADPDLNLTANRQLLAQALGNLIDNAVKYTPAGGHIEITAIRRANRDIKSVELCVADSGPGIAREQRERALQRFVRLDGARRLPGNGLGLSLVKAVASLHGAELMLADNAPGLRVTLRFEEAS